MNTEAHIAVGSDVALDSLVSVIIPTRNRSTLLLRAIESVCRQTYTNLEIIVVDDGSTDATQSLVQALSDSRLRYIRHELPKGAAAARNTGIRQATGAYISFLDDDDAWVPTKIARQLAAVGNYAAILCSSTIAAPRRDAARRKEVNLDDLRRGPFARGGTGVLLARADVLKSTLFDESLSMGQDWDIFIRIAQRHRIAYLDAPLLIYNDGTHDRITNAVVSMSIEQLENRFAILKKHQHFFGRWYWRHLGTLLLYGIKHRPNKVQHLLYTLRRCGMASTVRALALRIRERLIERLASYPRRFDRTRSAATDTWK